MVFNSLTFLAFFAIVLVLHGLPLPWTWKKVQLLLASYVFYAAWNPPFVLLLILAAVVDFFLAQAIHRSTNDRRRGWLLALSLTVNLGLLGFFKYANFFSESAATVWSWLGVDYAPPRWSIILPLGISFYTFETISYLVDVYRRKIEPWDSFLDYALFLTFFPHLVAGPIVRAHDFLPQCRHEKRASMDQFSWGLALMLMGLFQKVVLADGALAPLVDRVYGAAQSVGFVDAWLGTLAFAGQIYFDFAGYSACGIGAALSLGFVLNDNFCCPYAAIGFSDFWRRWHISLSSWLRDYLYISLGGNRCGAWRTNVNLMLTMLLGGLWHGASWQFVIWGGLHGSYLVAQRWWEGTSAYRRVAGLPGIRVVGALGTFLLVCLAWVFFRANTLADAWALLTAMLTPSATIVHATQLNLAAIGVITPLMLGGHWLLRDSSLEQLFARLNWPLRAAFFSALIIGLVLAPGDNRAFIYFQF